MRRLFKLIKRLFGAVGFLVNSAARKLFEAAKKMFETTKKLFWKIIGFVKSSMQRVITIVVILGLLAAVSTLFIFVNFLLVLVYLLGFLLTPVFLWWIGFVKLTTVNEGTAKAFMTFGALKRIVGKWRGHLIDSAIGNVRAVVAGEREETSWLGGLFFVGFWPLHSVYKYDFEYSKFETVGEKLKLVPRNLSGKDAIDYILIRPDTFGVQIDEAETIPPERIPVNIALNVSIKVENPEKALFKAPTNWWRKLEARLISLFRGWATGVTVDQILSLKGHPEQVWEVINQESPDLIPSIKNEWGIVIEENKVEIRDISFPPDVQKALKLKKQMELEAEANLRKQQVDAQATASATLGRLMESLSQGAGLDVDDLQAELQGAMSEEDPEERAKKVKAFWDAYDPNGRTWNLIRSERLGARMVLVGTPDGKPADPLTTLLATYMTLKEGGTGGGGNSGNREKSEEEKELDEFERGLSE